MGRRQTLPQLARDVYRQSVEERNPTMIIVQYLMDAEARLAIPGCRRANEILKSSPRPSHRHGIRDNDLAFRYFVSQIVDQTERIAGQEKAEFHTVVTWDRLAEIAAQYLGKGQLVAIEGRLQTRQWEDERKLRHWKTEIVANQVEMLSGRRRKDHAAEAAAEALAAQASQLGVEPHELAASTLDQELDDDDLAGLTDEVEADEPVAVAA